MMSEIEKLMQNAKVDKDCKLYANYGACPDKTKECTYCEYYVYPEFTAEKQLEIVKFMFHKGVYYDTDGDTYWFHYTNEIENATYRPFEEAAAEFVNYLWQFLIDTEKAEIKRILE